MYDLTLNVKDITNTVKADPVVKVTLSLVQSNQLLLSTDATDHLLICPSSPTVDIDGKTGIAVLRGIRASEDHTPNTPNLSLIHI